MQRAGAIAREAGLSAARNERLETAVAEATLNAIEHGNAKQPEQLITFQVLATPDTLVVRVGDQGDATFDPDAPRPDIEAMLAGEQSPRGWGLFLIQSMVDEVSLDTTSGQHVIELRMALNAPDA
jgi:anti-sigma regulatory factor (Ser/Thr protein kinase)